jgi:hypothetical protein
MSASRLDKIKKKLENVVAILATNPVPTANQEENAIEDTTVSAKNHSLVGCDSFVHQTPNNTQKYDRILSSHINY